MKKKLTVAIAMILLLAICATFFVGCDQIFTRNEKRDLTQVVATVEYNGETANIYKFELKSSYDQYAYYYVYYYQMSSEAAANYIVRSLAQQKLLALYAKAKVAEMMDITDDPKTIDVKRLLSNSEIDRAYDNVNDDLLTNLKNIIKEDITEDNYNSSSPSSNTSSSDKKVEVTDAVIVRFDTNGGGDIEKQSIQKGTKADEPEKPTKDGNTFYGWYTDAECTNKWDFNDDVTVSMTLYAKWVKYLAPRTERPEPEEVDDYDPKAELPAEKISKGFFSDEYQATVYDEIKDEDFVKDIKVPDNSTLKETLEGYIADAMTSLKKDMKSRVFKDTEEQCYQYYLNNQLDSVLIAKLERLIGEKTDVSETEVATEFNRVLEQNKETFGNSDASYENAIKSSLATTYLHTYTEDGYGFVLNILLKLDDENLKKLTDMYELTKNAEAVEIERNILISQMMINVSNPNYKASAKVDYGKDESGNDFEIADPMTDPNNKYNNIAADGSKTKVPDRTYQKEGGNNYTQIISFEKDDDGNYGIVYNATEAPTMAYLLEQVPAFDRDGKVGIIHQIYNSFEQVSKAVADNDLTKAQGIYWFREVGTAWLYLVGDDSGSVSSESNNGGLGYLVTPEGKDSSYLEDFTSYARELIGKGSGSYTTAAIDASKDFKGADAAGNVAGNNKAFVIADSFLKSGTVGDNAYAGVFVLLTSCKVWDSELYKSYSGKELPANGILPNDYILTFDKDTDNIKTLEEVIYDSLLKGKQSSAYNLDVNTMGLEWTKKTQFFNKVYKSIWKEN